VRRLALLESGVDLAVAKSILAWSGLVAIPNNRIRPRSPLGGMCLFGDSDKDAAQWPSEGATISSNR
jgi:hypothetical protein